MSDSFNAFQRDVRKLLETVSTQSGQIAPNELLFESTDNGKLRPSKEKKNTRLSISLGFPRLQASHPNAVSLKEALETLHETHAQSLERAHGLTLEVSVPRFSTGDGLIRLVLPHNKGGTPAERNVAFEHMRQFEHTVRDFVTPGPFKFVPRRRPV